MNLKVAVNNIFFDLSNPLCELILCAEKYAFIQAIESTHVGERKIKRYWGKWNINKPITSIEKILRQARPWPDLPSLPKQNNIIHFSNPDLVSAEPTLIDAYEAVDLALYQAQRTLEPHKKRKAAEALLQAYQEGEIVSLDFHYDELISGESPT